MAPESIKNKIVGSGFLVVSAIWQFRELFFQDAASCFLSDYLENSRSFLSLTVFLLNTIKQTIAGSFSTIAGFRERHLKWVQYSQEQ